MTAVVIALASVLLVSVSANAALGWWLRTARAEQARDNEKHLDERVALNELANQYKAERDSFAVGNATHVKRIGELEALLRSASSARDEATKETIRIKAERIRSGADDKTAAVEFGSVFGMPILPVLPKAGDSDPGGNDR